MIRHCKYLSLLALTILIGCSGGTETASTQAGLFGEVISARRDRRQEPAPLPTLTPELINSLTIASLEVVSDERDQTAFLIPLARRDNRRLVVWQSGDKRQIILRDGVLVGTRGLGHDLTSADAAPAVSAVRTRSDTGGDREMYIRNDLNGVDRMVLACAVNVVGPETIEIVGSKRATTHLRETCENTSGSFTNDYWADRRDGTVWKSRQWAGPGIGYLKMRLLKK